jgi:nucleoid-associated protein YgaU
VNLSKSMIFWAGALLVAATAVASPLLVRRLPIAWPGEQVAPVAVVSHSENSTAATPSPGPVPAADAEPTKAPSSVEAILARPAEQLPAFDIIRVEPTGDAVIAGHASPNAAVELRDDGLVVAQGSADASGQFAILPPTLSAGGHHLQLAAQTNDATTVLSDAVAVNVPAAAKAPIQAAPASEASTPSPAQTLATTETTKPAEASLVDAGIQDVHTTKVIRGDNLWHISQHYLGNGMRYRQIFAANASQVRNPQLIYPGQILVVPQSPALNQ